MSSAGFTQVLPDEEESTAVRENTCKVEWKVPNFSSITVNEDHFSPVVSSPEQSDFKCCIGLSVIGAGPEKRFLTFIKPCFPASNWCCIINYTLSIKDNHGRRISEYKVVSDISPDYVPGRTLHRILFADVIGAIADDHLILVADVSFVLLPAGIARMKHSPPWRVGYGLLADISVMLGSKLFSDVVLSVENHISMSVDGYSAPVTIPAHRLLLASRSAVFRNMLTGDTPESKHHVIRITDIDGDTVHHMLNYIYTDRFDDNLEINDVLELLKCSEKYLISGLKSLCEMHLIRNMNDETAFKCLIAADRYNAKELKTKSLEIICRNKRNMARLKDSLHSDVDEVDQEQRLRLITEILCQITMNCLPN